MNTFQSSQYDACYVSFFQTPRPPGRGADLAAYEERSQSTPRTRQAVQEAVQSAAQSKPCLPEMVPSRGSLGHPLLCATPCSFFRSARGCKDGDRCVRCHICTWKRCMRGQTKPCSSEAQVYMDSLLMEDSSQTRVVRVKSPSPIARFDQVPYLTKVFRLAT